ncbi:hypothetical protein VAG18_002846 [Escherichia coli]|nr:hypothetical protein [Escherichia coli]
MLVKGTHTVKESVFVDIDHNELERVLRSCSNTLLLSVLQERADREFLNSLAGRPGDFCIRKNGDKVWLWEIDADWDYHKDIGIDEPIRELTDQEIARYEQVTNWSSRQYQYLDPSLTS